MSEPLLLVRRDAVLELTLNRPECRNALSRELIARLTDALRAAELDAAVRSVILTGTPPAFCAGLDLGELLAGGDDGTVRDTADLLALYETVAGLSKPVVSAVNGAAAAGGAALLTVCDIVICAASAQVGYPGIRHGLVAPVVVPFLLRAVGPRRAAYLLLTGEMVASAQALACGLVDEVVADGDVLSRARQLAGSVAGLAPAALAETKALLRRIVAAREPDEAACDVAARPVVRVPPTGLS